MKDIYLETSAIIALSPKLHDLKASCYTSALAVFELISSINEVKFQRRKAAINAIYSPGIEVDWRMPREIICSAFPNIGIAHGNEGDVVKTIGTIVCAATSHSEAISKMQMPPFTLKTIREVDDKIGVESVANAMEWMKAHEKPPKPGEIHYVVPFREAIKSILDYYCASFTQKQKEVVAKNYDGSIDKFISTICLYMSFQMNARNQPAENDWIDLHHTLYLRDKGKFVTADKIQFNVVNAVCDDATLTVEDFMKLQEV